MNSSILSTITLFISEHFKELQQFLKSVSFSRAIRVGIAVTLPIVMGIQSELFGNWVGSQLRCLLEFAERRQW